MLNIHIHIECHRHTHTHIHDPDAQTLNEKRKKTNDPACFHGGNEKRKQKKVGVIFLEALDKFFKNKKKVKSCCDAAEPIKWMRNLCETMENS